MSVRRLFRRLSSFVRNGRAEADLAGEIAAHLRLIEDQFLAKGMSPDEARLAARRAFGGVEQAKEHQRDARSFRWLDDGRRDIGYAVRSLRRSPGFTGAALLTLALGIGAATAISSVVDAVLVQPLPFPEADRLVRLLEHGRTPQMPRVNYLEYLEWRSRTTTMSGLAAAAWDPQVAMRTPSGIARLTAGFVSTNYFEVLGSPAMLGRTLVSADDAGPNVAVLSFDTWRTLFRADPRVLGSAVETRSSMGAPRLVTIVGVMPEHMEAPDGARDVYIPILTSPSGRPANLVALIGRLRDGVSLAAASEEAEAIGRAVRPLRPASAPPLAGRRFEAESLKEGIVASLRPALRIFVTAVAVVLVIVCANVASLLLARGTARRREIAVRLAIGASRGRIVRQVLTECLVLAIAGGVLGAALGAAGVSMVKQLATIEAPGIFRQLLGANLLPRHAEIGVDLRLLGIALSLAAGTSVLFGLLPAVHMARTSSLQAMGARGGGATMRETRVRTALVVAQLAMATVLLVGAGLLSSSFLELARVTKGYDPTNVLAFQLVVPEEYSTVRKAETIERLLARVRAMPDVEASGFAFAGILVGIQNTVGWFVPPGRTLDQIAAEPEQARLKSISPGYLEAVRARVLDGRLLTDADATAPTPAIIVNRTVARRYFGGTSPVGSHMDWHAGSRAPVRVQVLGVVEDIRQGPLDREPYPEIFIDYRPRIGIQERWGTARLLVDHLAFGFMSFAVRTRDDPRAAIPAVREAVASVDPNAGLDAILPLERLVASSMARQRFYAVLLGVFAGVAALLAAVGIYGVLAYAVVQRTQEIGVRMALGARRTQVLGLVLGRGAWLAAIGIGLGLAGAAAGTRYLQGMLFGVTPLDAGTFALVGLAFATLAIVASYVPARRATQVDPMIALRRE